MFQPACRYEYSSWEQKLFPLVGFFSASQPLQSLSLFHNLSMFQPTVNLTAIFTLNGQDEVVTREFVRTTILWLLDAAMKERLGRRDEDGDDFRSAGGRWI